MRRLLGFLTALLLVGVAIGSALLLAGPGSGDDRDDLAGKPRQSAAPLRGDLVDTLGVASFNVYRHLSRRDALADALKLTADRDVDVIGWQETRARYFPAIREELASRGWETWQLWQENGPFWLAVSWRRADFELVGGHWTEAHGGAGKRRTDLPFPPRGFIEVTLRHKETGKLLTVVDTHLNQGIEEGDGFSGRVNASYARTHLKLLAKAWDRAPGDLVVGTGDFNFDHLDDREARPRGGVLDTQRGYATSSYQVLGLDGVTPTRGTRWIDYVWIADRDLREHGKDRGTGQFVEHRSLGGYHSDHRPLLATVRWYR